MCNELFQNSADEVEGAGLTEKIKISGPELFFLYLLRLANVLIGITVFALLMHLDPVYATTMEKVRAASGFPMSEMIYIVCPATLLLSGLLLSAFHSCAEPWRAMGSSEKWTLQQFVPKPKSKIISKEIPTPDVQEPGVHAGDQAEVNRRPVSEYEGEYDYMGETREQSAKKRRTHSAYENGDAEDDYDYMG